MTKEEFQNRTKKFALDVIKLISLLPNKQVSRVIENQLVKSSTSVAANYRAVCRSKSKADFISKLNIVLEEADESLFWLELIVESNLIRKERVDYLLKEANEITAIMAASLKSVKANSGKS